MTRARTARWRSGRSALAALLWLNLAILPCSVLASGGLPCGSCPKEVRETGHSGHGDHGGAMSDAGHAAMDGVPDCFRVAPDCCDADVVSSPDRPSKPAKPATVDAVTIADRPVIAPPSRPAVFDHYGTGPPGIRLGFRRLHAIHCVYRD